MRGKSVIGRLLGVIAFLGYAQGVSSARGFDWGKCGNYANCLSKKVAGMFVPQKIVLGDEIVIPAHETNACWLNSVFGAFSNLVDPWMASYLRNQIEHRSLNGKRAEGLRSVLSDLSRLRYGTQRTLSKETKEVFGYVGRASTVGAAIARFNELLKGTGFVLERSCWVTPGQGDDLVRNLQKLKKSKNKITFFVVDIHNVLGFLNHVYCLHVVREHDGKWGYYLANDKGRLLNYNAQYSRLTEAEAENLLRNKGLGCVYLDLDQETRENLRMMDRDLDNYTVG